jgi:lipopolysaccharide/colanic/teichoic acid biosynthesis glycosyltransferase
MARTETLLDWTLNAGSFEWVIAPSSGLALRLREFAYQAARRTIDLVVASALLVAVLPVLAAAAVAIRLTNPGPVFFQQVRAGRNGRPFQMYKLRTMYLGAEGDKHRVANLNEMPDGPCFKIRRDPRVTPVGRFLRRSSIDELPQLVNVLRGEMTLVGPRPLPLDEIRTNTWTERQRLSVTPGLTCLWQISGRTEIPYSEWIILDQFYIQNRCLALDLKILLKTVPAVISGRGAY